MVKPVVYQVSWEQLAGLTLQSDKFHWSFYAERKWFSYPWSVTVSLVPTQGVATLHFFGLLGHASPMPLSYTERLQVEESQAVHSFLSLFESQFAKLMLKVPFHYHLLCQPVRLARVGKAFSGGGVQYWWLFLGPYLRQYQFTAWWQLAMPGRLLAIEQGIFYRKAFKETSRLGQNFSHLGESYRLSERLLLNTGSLKLVIDVQDLSELWPGTPYWQRLHSTLLHYRASIHYCELLIQYQAPDNTRLGQVGMWLGVSSQLTGSQSKREARLFLDLTT